MVTLRAPRRANSSSAAARMRWRLRAASARSVRARPRSPGCSIPLSGAGMRASLTNNWTMRPHAGTMPASKRTQRPVDLPRWEPAGPLASGPHSLEEVARLAMEILLVPVALLVGGLLAVQAAANLQLSGAAGSPVGASTLQLGIGALLLTLAAALAGALGAVDLIPDAEPWHLLGGLGSAVYITAGILLFPRLGALVSVGLFVAGQMLASLALDSFGLLGVERIAPSAARLAGAAAVVAGIALVVRAQTRERAPAAARPAVVGGSAAPPAASAGRAGRLAAAPGRPAAPAAGRAGQVRPRRRGQA